MPTTDPGSDIHFSTDDELCGDGNYLCSNNDICSGVFGTVPRTRKILLQSELQRRYIEEIGDGSEILRRMPPELIVTSPTKSKSSVKSNSQQMSCRPPTIAAPAVPSTPKTAPTIDKRLVREFPMLGMGNTTLSSMARRTNSWHNLHNSGKCVPKIK